MTTSPGDGVVTSATGAARQHGVRAVHLGRGELRLDLATPCPDGLDGGDGRLVPLARPRHLLRPWWVGVLILGQQPCRLGCRVLGPLLLNQDAEQSREVVTVHPAFLNR